MPLITFFKEGAGTQFHEKKGEQVILINTLPGVEQNVEVFNDSNISIVSLNPSLRKKIFSTREYTIALEGDILNIPSLQDVLDLYLKNGDSFVGSLNGNFNLLVYSSLRKQVEVFNCKSSLYNFYYNPAPETNGFVLSSNIKTIVALQEKTPEINFSALYKLFSFSYIFDTDTLVEGVKRFSPASFARIEKNRLTVRQYWHPEFKNFFDLNLVDVTKEFNKRLTEAMSLRYEYFKEITLFLSGGLDSRLIAAAAEKAGAKAETLTYGFPGSKDLEFGKLCSDRLGFKNHQYISQPGETKYSDILSLVIWLSEGQSDIGSMTGFKYHSFLIEKKIRNYSNGSTLPLLSSNFIPIYSFLPVGLEKKIDWTFKKLTSKHSKTNQFIFERSFNQENLNEIKNSFFSSFNDAKGSNFADRFLCWFFKNRETRLSFNTVPVNSYYFTAVHAFLDNNLIDFYFRVPLKHRLEMTYQKMACLTLNEKITDVPHQMTSKPISANLWINAKNRVMDKVFENAKFMHTTKHKDKKGDTRNDVQLKSYLFDKLGSKSHFDSVFDKKNLSNFITEFYGGKHNNYAAILKVASIYKFEELFLKLKCSSFPTEAESLLKKIPYQPLKG